MCIYIYIYILQGIVTKCSLVRPKILKSVHFCEETKATLQKSYRYAIIK